MKIAVFYASDTQAGIIEGFKDLGHTVIPLYYGLKQLSLPGRAINRLLKRSWVNLARLFNEKILDFDRKIIDINPDLILFIKGQYLNDRSKAILEKWAGIRKIQWTIDSLVRFPGQATLFTFMDSVFFQDGDDVKMHPNGKWLPLGFDNKLFKYCSEKTIDLLMLGNLQKPFYIRRCEYFSEASKLGTAGLNVCFAGYNAGSELTDVFKKNKVKMLGKLPLSEYASVISTAKVCLNVNQDDGGKAINPLFFAIPATGSMQVTDDASYLKGWLNPGYEYFPAEHGKLNETIVNLVNGYGFLSREISEKIDAEHSYRGCAKKILEAF